MPTLEQLEVFEEHHTDYDRDLYRERLAIDVCTDGLNDALGWFNEYIPKSTMGDYTGFLARLRALVEEGNALLNSATENYHRECEEYFEMHPEEEPWAKEQMERVDV